MKVMLGSAFRNSLSRGHLPRYFRQAVALRDALAAGGHTLGLIAAEGDSADGTRGALVIGMHEHQLLGTVRPCDHGQREFGSTEEPARFRALAGVGNAILRGVPLDADRLVYVESDLIWDAPTILALLDTLQPGQPGPRVDIVSPLIFAGEHFYDVFAYRGLDGSRFAPFAPYHATLQGFTEVMSVGSCLVMRAEVARSARVPDADGLVGFCRDARGQGYRVWVDPAQRVRHPA